MNTVKIKAPAIAKLIRARGLEIRASSDESVVIARKYDKAGLSKIITKAFEKIIPDQPPSVRAEVSDFLENGIRQASTKRNTL